MTPKAIHKAITGTEGSAEKLDPSMVESDAQFIELIKYRVQDSFVKVLQAWPRKSIHDNNLLYTDIIRYSKLYGQNQKEMEEARPPM